MAASTQAATAALRNTLTGMFTTERNGTALGHGLVEVMVQYLLETLLIRDASEVDIEDARSIAEDAWAEANSDDKLPRHHLRKVMSWVGAAPTPTHGHGGHVEKGPVIL